MPPRLTCFPVSPLSSWALVGSVLLVLTAPPASSARRDELTYCTPTADSLILWRRPEAPLLGTWDGEWTLSPEDATRAPEWQVLYRNPNNGGAPDTPTHFLNLLREGSVSRTRRVEFAGALLLHFDRERATLTFGSHGAGRDFVYLRDGTGWKLERGPSPERVAPAELGIRVEPAALAAPGAPSPATWAELLASPNGPPRLRRVVPNGPDTGSVVWIETISEADVQARIDALGLASPPLQDRGPGSSSVWVAVGAALAVLVTLAAGSLYWLHRRPLRQTVP